MMQDMASGFNPFAPGFDFLKQLTEGRERLASSQFPQWTDWVAPTMNVQELDKRIHELKTIQFWLEQNQRALAATIQALEVQKMTLATLQTMNVPMENLTASVVQSWRDLASAAEASPPTAEAVNPYGTAFAPAAPAETAPPPEPPQAEASPAADAAGASTVDPMQWWGALTQQFQQIASQAIQDVAQRTMAQAAAANQAAAASAADVMQKAEQAHAGMAAAAKPARKAAASSARKAAAPSAGTPRRSTAASAKTKSTTPKPRAR